MSKDPTLASLQNMDLLSFVSHELKTPLTTLTLSLEGLKSWCQKEGHKPTKKEINFFLKKMEEEVSWMSRFVSDILDFRKGFGVLKPRWISWNDLALEVTDRLNLLRQHLKVSVQVPPPLKEDIFEIYADPLYLKQALLNVLLNAVEHSPEKSTIHFTWGAKGAKPLAGEGSSPSRSMSPSETLSPLFEASSPPRKRGSSDVAFTKKTGVDSRLRGSWKPPNVASNDACGNDIVCGNDESLLKTAIPEKVTGADGEGRGRKRPSGEGPSEASRTSLGPFSGSADQSARPAFCKTRSMDFRGNDEVSGNDDFRGSGKPTDCFPQASMKEGVSSASAPLEGFLVEIEDQGGGLKPGEEDLIFNPFYKGRDLRSETVFKGSGLGLALVKGIVQAHGGFVQVKKSKRGPGLVFQISLPHFRLRQKPHKKQVA